MDRIFRKPQSFALLSFGLALVASCDLNRVNSPESGSPSTPKALRTGEIVRLPNLVGSARDSIFLPFEADSGRFYTILVGSGRIRPSASIFRDGAKVFAGKRGSADNQVDSIFLPCVQSGTYDLRIAMDSSFHDQTVVLLGDRGLPDSLQLPDARGWRDSAVIPTDGTVWELTRHGWAGMELETNDTIAMDCDTGFRYIVKDSTLIGHNYLSLSRIVNSDGTSAGYHQIYGGGGGWVFVPTRKGRCFLVFGGSSSVSRYEVSVQKVPGVPASAVVDRFEPDDMFANAKSIFPDGVWQERTIHSNTGNDLNPDYVAFQVDSDKVYSLKIEEGSAAGTATDEAKLRNQRSPLEAIAFWADSSRIPTKDSVGEDMRYLIVPATKTGVVYVRFASYSYGIGYRIALGVVPGAMSEATGTRRGVRLVAAPEKDSFSLSMILTGNDTDCIAIAVRKNRLYTFAPSIQAGLAHLSTTIVESGISTETGSLNYAAVKDGIVHLKLLQVRWQPHPCSKMEPYCLSYSPGPYMQYNLSVGSRELPADPLEPDETMATAPQIDYGTDAIHRWLGMSERDWARFAVSVKQRTRIVVRVDSTYEPGRGGYSVSLIGRDSIMVESQVLENASVGDSVVFDFQPFNDGDIHLQ